MDTTTSGTWKGNYGADGNLIVADSTAAPAYATVTPRNHQQWVWAWSTLDARGPQRAAVNDRIAPCWYSGNTFDIDVSVAGDTARLVSLYFLDWDNAGRSQKVEVLDKSTGALLHTTTVANFVNGAYAQYRLKGELTFRLTRVAGANAVVSGIFFDR